MGYIKNLSIRILSVLIVIGLIASIFWIFSKIKLGLIWVFQTTHSVDYYSLGSITQHLALFEALAIVFCIVLNLIIFVSMLHWIFTGKNPLPPTKSPLAK